MGTLFFNFVQLLFHRILFSLKGKNKRRGEEEEEKRFPFFFNICTSFKLVTKVRKIILSMHVARPIFSGSFKIENNRKRKKFARIIPLVSVSKKVNKIMIRRMGTDSTCKCCHKTPTRDSTRL